MKGALVGGLGGLALPGAAWAHHPGAGGGGPWIWLALLIAGLALLVLWPLLAFLGRRRPPKP